MIKAVLFDLDGVLVDACEWHYQALNEALSAEIGPQAEIARHEHEAIFNGLPTKVKLEKLVEWGRVPKGKSNVINQVKQIYTARRIRNEMGRPDRERIDLMDHLKDRGIERGCVSNCSESTATLMLELAGIKDFLNPIITNMQMKPKPDPDGYLKAMDILKVKPEETLIVEDSPKGLTAAFASGAHVFKATRLVSWEMIKEYFT